MVLKIIFFALLSLLLVTCDEDGRASTGTKSGPFKVTFSLDDSFQKPHGNNPIQIALVRLSDGFVIAQDMGTVSDTEDPSFLFTTPAIMDRGKSYAVQYWIDSNIGGGTVGLCDSTEFDHQWSSEFFTVTNDINFTVSHQPGLVEYVCNTFF